LLAINVKFMSFFCKETWVIETWTQLHKFHPRKFEWTPKGIIKLKWNLFSLKGLAYSKVKSTLHYWWNCFVSQGGNFVLWKDLVYVGRFFYFQGEFFCWVRLGQRDMVLRFILEYTRFKGLWPFLFLSWSWLSRIQDQKSKLAILVHEQSIS
jgi:hypothetical protein